MEIKEFTSLNQLATTAGSVVVVTLITQYVKEFLPEKFPIRLFVLLLSLVLQVGLVLIMNPSVEAIESIILAIVNAFVVATSAMGTYEASFNKHGRG